MTTWSELRSYIHSKYAVQDEEPGNITLRFGTADGRSQLVFIALAEMNNFAQEQWIQIQSGIAERSAVSQIWRILDEISTDTVGGLSLAGDYLTIRHSVRLADMTVDEFESPLRAVVVSADFLEAVVTGQDRF